MNNDNTLNNFDYWRLCDELTVFQAALPTVGVSPSSSDSAYCACRQVHEKPDSYDAVKTAIGNALKKSCLAGALIPQFDTDLNGNPLGPIDGSIDVTTSTVDVDPIY